MPSYMPTDNQSPAATIVAATLRLLDIQTDEAMLALRKRSERIAHEESARGRLRSGMHAEAQRELFEAELRQRIQNASAVLRERIIAAGVAVDGEVGRTVSSAVNSFGGWQREHLAAELASRLRGIGIDLGPPFDLQPALGRALGEAAAATDLWVEERTLLSARVPHFTAAIPGATVPVWDVLHPAIVAVAHSRYDSGHYADAAEAAMKVVNDAVKAIHLAATGNELDGTDLMHNALGSHPSIVVGDGTDTGQSMQMGYRFMFAGAMAAIRNPKAHSVITISAQRCVHFLFVASLLMYKLDERLN